MTTPVATHNGRRITPGRRPEPLVEPAGGRRVGGADPPGGPSRRRFSPLAVPARKASTLTTGLAKARWASREAESTVAVTDSVPSKTASTLAISPWPGRRRGGPRSPGAPPRQRSASTPLEAPHLADQDHGGHQGDHGGHAGHHGGHQDDDIGGGHVPDSTWPPCPRPGSTSARAPVEPKKSASPKLNSPPSAATSQ